MSGNHLKSYDLRRAEARMFRDIPSPAESERFNTIFCEKIIDAGISGVTVDGEPNDLAMAFEKAYVKEYEETNKVNEENLRLINELTRHAYDPEEGGQSELSEENITEHADFARNYMKDVLQNAIRTYLEKNNGRIGRFPYAYSRKVVLFEHPLREELVIRRIDPIDLRWNAVRVDHLADGVENLALPEKNPFSVRARRHTIIAASFLAIFFLLGLLENLLPSVLPAKPYLFALDYSILFSIVFFVISRRNRKYDKACAEKIRISINSSESAANSLTASFDQALFELRFFDLWLRLAPEEYKDRYSADCKKIAAELARLEKIIAQYNEFVLSFNSALSDQK